jgi:hypothetical protein
MEGRRERMKRQSGETEGQTDNGEEIALLAKNTKSEPNSAVIILPILSMYFE